MVVKDFMPISQPKQTIEKQVVEKIPKEERITIESPGKPVPASLLEDNEPKKKRKSPIRKNKTTKNVKIEEPKKEYALIITEKPQAAQKIASALGKPDKYTENGVSYFEVEREGKLILIASAVGHLFNLEYKKGQKGWPIFETEWRPSYENKRAAFTKRYFDLLKNLARKAHTFIIASDYDVEGEVIGWNVLRFLCKQNNALRMKFSTLTSEELENSFLNPEQELNWGNAYAGETRHIIDWLYGINLSRALMSAIKSAGLFRILSIGRVQGPALKIIVEREKEILNFKPVPYWQVFAFSNNIKFKHPRDIFDKKLLEKFKGIKEAEAKTTTKEEKTPPPFPFDLTTLQREAYRWHKISPSETLSIVQRLYLEGLISYPRTSSQKIPDAIKPKKILEKLSKYFQETKFATRNMPIEGKKTDPAHPSIYPTGDFKKLEGRDEKLYNLIVKRFISAFSPDLLTSNKKIILTALNNKGKPLKYLLKREVKTNEYEENDKNNSDDNEKENNGNSKNNEFEEIIIAFTANAQTILDKGWTLVYPAIIEESKLPDLNGKVKIDKIEFEEKQTSPPPRYTPASLIVLLEKKNLGTKTTRSLIIETLFERGYLDGKIIQATPLGMKLIDTLEKHSSIIIDENLTRQLEEQMEKMQESKGNLEDKEKEVIEKAKRIILDISKEFKAKEETIGKELASALNELREEQRENNTLMLCPTCKKGNLRIMFNKKSRRYFVACSAYPECRQTYSLPPNALIKKADDKKCEADNFPKLLAIRKAKRPWEFCFNPECPIEKAKREEWDKNKQV